MSWSRSEVVSGTNQLSSAIASIVSLSASPPDLVERPQQVLGVQHADDVLLAVPPQRQARVGR